jgi:putative endonuclease
MFFVYILRSEKNGRLYTGSSDNVEKRLGEHNAGRSKATRYIKPFKLLYKEEFATRAEAVRRERLLKTGKGREELAAILRKRGLVGP